MYVPIDIEKAVRKECKRRRYSDKTAKSYCFCINRFLKHTGKTIDKISKKDVRLFLEHLSEKGRTGNTMNVYHMALRFLFQDVLDRRMWVDIHYSKVPEKIPVSLTKEEVKRLFDAIENEKHKLMVQLIYAAGLRVSAPLGEEWAAVLDFEYESLDSEISSSPIVDTSRVLTYVAGVVYRF